MAIGERIRFIRNLRGMTQKYLGTLVGFPEKTADIRMAQYEAGSRTPKEDLTKALANALEVSPLALNIPDIDSYLGLMHTLFALEDRYGLTIETQDGEVVFRIDPRKGKDAAQISEMVYTWASIAEWIDFGSPRMRNFKTYTLQTPLTFCSIPYPAIPCDSNIEPQQRPIDIFFYLEQTKKHLENLMDDVNSLLNLRKRNSPLFQNNKFNIDNFEILFIKSSDQQAYFFCAGMFYGI